MAQVATIEEGAVARPLSVLVPLIRKDLEDAENAGIEFYEAAGAKLNEAREGHFQGNSAGFFAWAEKNFGRKPTQIRAWTSLATARLDKPRKTFKSLDHFHRQYQGHDRQTTGRMRREWTAPVDAVAEKARNEARRLALEDSLSRQQEREADHKLAMRLIDIGFKVLARELHPDKGGSKDAMARLSRVRDRLKECA